MNSNDLSDLIINKVYSVNRMFSDKNMQNTRKNRPCWAIVLKHEGETEYYTDEKKYVSNASHMVILPKGCDYRWICTQKGHFSIIEFDADKTGEEIYRYFIPNNSKIIKIFNELENSRLINNPFYDMERIKCTYEVLLTLLQSRDSDYSLSSKFDKIQPSVDYIAKNYNKEITNDCLSGVSNISTVYFRKIFTGAYGTSPINYVHKLRIDKAKEMLKSDYGTIGNVAQAVGYPNIYHFSKIFKQHTGVSPKKYATTKHFS